MTVLDLNFIRGQFPAFAEGALQGFAHFDNAGGSYACRQTIEWLERYYDTHNSSVIHATSVLRNLQSSEISIEVPDISATLEALRNLRPMRERGAR